MDNLNNIPNVGNWGDAASKLNDNFNKIKQSLTTVENTSKNNKGYFTSLSALNTAYPSPKAGQTAYVYGEASSTNYYIYNAVNGAWVTASIEAPSVGVDIAGYTKTGGSTKTTKDIDDEIAQLAGDASAGVLNMSQNGEVYADLQTMLQSVPANKRKRGQSIIWKSPDKWYTHKMQHSIDPETTIYYENPNYWLDTSNSTPIFVEFDTDRNTTRLSIPLSLRFNGMTISYMEDGKLRIEHYYDPLGRIINPTNFTNESLWYNLTDEDIITQEMGDSSDLVVSQKTITSEIGTLDNKKMDNDKYVENLSKNLFDKSAIQMNKVLHTTTSSIVSGTGYAISDWIKVYNGQTYTLTTGFTSNVLKRVAKFADYGDTEAIGVIENTGTFTSDFDGYVCFPVMTSSSDHRDIIQLERGSIATDYEPYVLNEKIKEQYIPSTITSKIETLDNKKMDNDKYVENLSKNLFDKSAIQMNKLLGTTTGSIVNETGYAISDWIKVYNGQTYTLTTGFGSNLFKRMSKFADYGDTEAIGVIENTGTFTSDFNGYVCFIVATNTSNHTDIIQLEIGSIATDYEPYILNEKIKEKYLPEIPMPDLESTDIHINQSVFFEKDEFEENKVFYDSIRKLPSSENDPYEVSINISNTTGEVLTDVIVPINIHKKSQGKNAGYRHVFFDGKINNDFSDLRAFVGSDMIDMNIVSSGNYSAFPHDLGKRYLSIQKVGDTWFGGRGHITDISTDFFDTVTTLFEDVEFAFADAEQNIYGRRQGQSDLVKFYKSTSYTTSKTVIVPPAGLSESVWRLKNLAIDKFGHMYIGAYQETPNARVYKSTDTGETWFMIFTPEMVGSQHVHNIICDKTVEPNKLYLSFDGSIKNDQLRQSQWTSVDYGATWQRDDHRPKLKGFDVDNGVMYAEGGNLVCGGEAAIKYCPALYTSKNDEESFEIKLWGQNIHLASKLGNLYIACGTNYIACKESDIWASYDLDKWFRINHILNLDASVSGTGNGYRYGSFSPIKDENNKDCIILVANDLQDGGTRSPMLKLMVGEDYYSALVHVRIPILPINGATVTFKNNFAIAEPKRNMFNRDLPAKYQFPLNERLAKLDYAETVSNPKWHYKFDSYGINLEGENTVPYSRKGMIKMSDFGIDIPSVIPGSFSVSFWYGYPYDADFSNTSYSLIEVGNVGVRFSLSGRVVINIDGSEFYVRNVLKLDSMQKPSLCTVIFNKPANRVDIYIDNNLTNSSTRTLTTISANRIKAGFKTANINQLGYISDLMIYDYVLTKQQVNQIFYKSNII